MFGSRKCDVLTIIRRKRSFSQPIIDHLVPNIGGTVDFVRISGFPGIKKRQTGRSGVLIWLVLGLNRNLFEFYRCLTLLIFERGAGPDIQCLE